MLLIITESGFKTFQDVFNIMDMNSIMARVMSIPPSPKSPITTTTTTTTTTTARAEAVKVGNKRREKEEERGEYCIYPTSCAKFSLHKEQRGGPE